MNGMRGARITALVHTLALSMIAALAFEGEVLRYELKYDTEPSVNVSTDADGVPDASDNCPNVGNPEQNDYDDDGKGDDYGDVGGGKARCDEVDNRYGLYPGVGGRANRNAIENIISGTAAEPSTKHVILPPGDYHLDNTAGSGRIRLMYFAGTLEMRPGARFVGDNWAALLGIKYATGATFRNLEGTLAATGDTLNSNPCFQVSGSSGLTFDGLEAYGCAAGGMIVYDSDDTVVRNANVRNTKADGIRFQNSSNSQVYGYVAQTTGDDALAYMDTVNDGTTTNNGGYATDVDITDAGTRGIAINGQSGVTVENFSVDGTCSRGTQVVYENTARWTTGHPKNVVFRNGTVSRAGLGPKLLGRCQEPTIGYALFYYDPGEVMTGVRWESVEVLSHKSGWNCFGGDADEPEPTHTGSCPYLGVKVVDVFVTWAVRRLPPSVYPP